MQQPHLSQATGHVFSPLTKYSFLNYSYLHIKCCHYSIPQVCFMMYSNNQERPICNKSLFQHPTLSSPFWPLKKKKSSGYYINNSLELRSRQFNWGNSNLRVMTERTIYFSQERADAFTVHRQIPHWDHGGPPHLFIYPPADVKGHSPSEMRRSRHPTLNTVRENSA